MASTDIITELGLTQEEETRGWAPSFLPGKASQRVRPDLSATANWPQVPACYGWLSLDRRGCWRLKGQAISHAGLISFHQQHYGADDSGNWVFRNGPQMVFVALDYTPLVLRLDVDGRLTANTGAAPTPSPRPIWIRKAMHCWIPLGYRTPRRTETSRGLRRLVGMPAENPRRRTLCWKQ